MSYERVLIEGESVSINLPAEQEVVVRMERDALIPFVVNLLGEPEVIGGVLSGHFSLTIEKIAHIHQAITQSIEHQHTATLVKFSAKVAFSDGTTESINDAKKLQTFATIRPVTTHAIHLLWSYLIVFPGRPSPEKQEIKISFIHHIHGVLVHPNIDPVFLEHSRVAAHGAAIFEISYTSREWATDVEALIRNLIEGIIRKPSPTRRFFKRHSDAIGFAMAAIMFFGSLSVGLYQTVLSLAKRQEQVLEILKHDQKAILGYVATEMASGFWSRFIYAIIAFIPVVLIVSVIVAVLISSYCERERRSFILVTEQDNELRQAHDKNLPWQRVVLIIKVGASIGAGVVANLLYVLLGLPKG